MPGTEADRCVYCGGQTLAAQMRAVRRALWWVAVVQVIALAMVTALLLR
jgi:hypothetical protein